MQELDWSAETSGVTLNADLEPKTHHQTLVHMDTVFRHFQSCCNGDGNAIFKCIVSIALEVPFSVLKKRGANTFVHIVNRSTVFVYTYIWYSYF